MRSAYADVPFSAFFRRTSVQVCATFPYRATTRPRGRGCESDLVPCLYEGKKTLAPRAGRWIAWRAAYVSLRSRMAQGAHGTCAKSGLQAQLLKWEASSGTRPWGMRAATDRNCCTRRSRTLNDPWMCRPTRGILACLRFASSKQF
jgi:hypothetical protein